MSQLIKSFLTFLLFIANATAIGMESQQLQVQNQAKQDESITLNCSLMISNQMENPIVYTTKSVHAAQYTHLPSNPNDPMIFVDIISPTNDYLDIMPIAAKHLYKLQTGSPLQLQQKNGSTPLNGKRLLFNALCQINPELEGESFSEQFTLLIDEFYKKPQTYIPDGDSLKELKKSGIIIKEMVTILLEYFNKSTNQYELVGHIHTKALEHGPHGVSDEKALIETL